MNPECFDYKTIAMKLNIPKKRLKQLEDMIYKEFPRDKMMFELHMLRLLNSTKKGRVDIQEFISL
ncbi:MAG: hypothetical protein A2Y62_07925 [Candidatus Fischerbacteria bacterium RBG_13_37_8]|uniref:EF-hand domain-containing protein n=1 Tax=Candidatus Fischerbacteria bacterium RBG_13_37_8 TaxID=1817863 RepID=A0A1F5V5B0_9BACT|nr:MAG: hypothetical protein A2Y62_07925 [Candidatus Fischerbacteria bacterium RBG_13_37_8]